jgi:hypothetical protein
MSPGTDADRPEGAGAEEMRTLLLQPKPDRLQVIHPTPDSTAMMRGWKPGDPQRCRLCPRAECTADANDYCLVAVPDYVPNHECGMFSLARWRAERAARLGIDWEAGPAH